MGSQIVRMLGLSKFWLVGFKNGKIHGKKVVTEGTVALLISYFTSHITFLFEITIILLTHSPLNRPKPA